ncbi:hypothetical protein LTR62_007976 [Meristemomyces frigidus]|uniref:Uncharacterized protein n=1 Tax=Meristemomyces frigidus TaxID=1508187 RepID=A0AAN7YRA5_9PEZI|nr:hypothetical protein LTR62_007976 [Meristemomyces frigidus]
MRRGPRSYRTLDAQGQEKVPWYWRILALGAAIIILGGFLILPVTFDSDPGLRISKAALGIFAIALLTAGFSFTVLLCYAVRMARFQNEAVFLPALVSCALGLLTVFYDFLISSKFIWNVPALLVIVAASLSTIIYGGLLIWGHRRMPAVKAQQSAVLPLRRASFGSSISPWQEPTFYENFNRNMFPTSIRETPPQQQQQQAQGGYDPNEITEEEMQRQQMLMLLLHREQPPTPDPSQSTFRIDWQGQEVEDGLPTPHPQPPTNGYYAPQPQTAYAPQSAFSFAEDTPASARPGFARQWTGELRPWDGVWRGVGTPPRGRASENIEVWERAASRDRREVRRREIEEGRG